MSIMETLLCFCVTLKFVPGPLHLPFVWIGTESTWEKYDPRNIVLMDETAVVLEKTEKGTADVIGARHVGLRSTEYASMRITSILAVRRNGKRMVLANIFKGKRSEVTMISGCYPFTQPKDWVDSNLLCTWILFFQKL